MTYHLAQLNIAKLLAPTDSPLLADFMSELDAVNALAEQAEGFVWRYVEADNNATALRPYADPMVMINMSVWESAESLHTFTYRNPEHLTLLRQRSKWFAKPTEPILVMWWLKAGTLPTVTEAMARLEHLREHGATPHAFTFSTRFPPPALD